MSDPVRLLDLDGDPMGTSLLRAGLDDAPPPGAKDAVFRSLQGALSAALIAGAAGVAASASASTGASAAAGGTATTTATSSAIASGTVASGAATATASAAVKTGLVKALVVKLGLAKTIGVVGLCSATVVVGALGARELARDRSPLGGAPTLELVASTAGVGASTSSRTEGPGGRHAEIGPAGGNPVAGANRVEEAPPVPGVAVVDPARAAGSASSGARALTALNPTPPVKADPTAPSPPSKEPDAIAATTPPAVPSGLSSESAGVTDVRAKLRAGDAGGALALLQAMQKQFGAGRLSEDRAVLTIEALAASGNTAAARANADAFLAAHPTSPFASRVRSHASH